MKEQICEGCGEYDYDCLCYAKHKNCINRRTLEEEFDKALKVVHGGGNGRRILISLKDKLLKAPK